MGKEVLLCFEFVCSGACFECSADPALSLQQIIEGLQPICPMEIREEFDLCQPLILCDALQHKILDEKKTAAQLRLDDGFKILIY